MRDQISSAPRQIEREPDETVPVPRVQPVRGWYLPVKALLDFIGACLLGAILFPIVLIAVVLIKLTSRGPAFYLQTRVGKYGRPFTLIKLRTMIHNAEALTGPVWATANDSRVTLIGRYLRDLHIDEFPQLLNVIAGHMSLIGPRPERPEFVSRLEWVIRDYRERLNVRPGISGLAQLKLPADSDVDSVRRKLIHDLYYVRNVSPWLDAKLMLFTGGLLLVKSIRGTVRHLALPSTEEIENLSSGAVPLYREPQQFADGTLTSQGDPAATQA